MAGVPSSCFKHCSVVMTCDDLCSGCPRPITPTQRLPEEGLPLGSGLQKPREGQVHAWKNSGSHWPARGKPATREWQPQALCTMGECIQSLTTWNLDMRPGCLAPSTGDCSLRGCASYLWVLRRPGRESLVLLPPLGPRDMHSGELCDREKRHRGYSPFESALCPRHSPCTAGGKPWREQSKRGPDHHLPHLKAGEPLWLQNTLATHFHPGRH